MTKTQAFAVILATLQAQVRLGLITKEKAVEEAKAAAAELKSL